MRIDRKGSLLDFSNFRKRIMFVNRSIDSLLTRTLPTCVYTYIYIYISLVILQITKREVEIPEILLDRSSP